MPAIEPLHWQQARITRISELTPRIKGFHLLPERPLTWRAGQHVDLRLVAEDGYVAQRSYSIASAPGSGPMIELAIERLADGEVSGFLHDGAEEGDEIGLRGPLGGHFVRDPLDGPAFLVGGGSGVVPLVAMLRDRRALAGRQAVPPPPLSLLCSARGWDELPFRDELLAEDGRPGVDIVLALTREPARRAKDVSARLDPGLVAAMLARMPAGSALALTAFVCGANGFVNAASAALAGAGIAPRRIRTERYGG